MKTLENIVDTCLVAVVIITTIAVASAHPALNAMKTMNGDQSNVGGRQNSGHSYAELGLRTFSSYEELVNYLRRQNAPDNRICYGKALLAPSIMNATFAPDSSQDDLSVTIPGDDSGGGTGIDFSNTNIQVEGVDEADIAKTDGKFIYVVSRGRVFIIDAYPAESAKILSKIDDVGYVIEIYIKGDKLVLLGLNYVKVYDISNKETPVLKRNVSFNGNYFKSRMIGGYVYIIVSSPVPHWVDNIELPYISLNGEIKVISATEIYYFENLRGYYNFTTIMAINAANDYENITSGTILMTATQNLYVSMNNIYVTYTTGYYWRSWASEGGTKTMIYKLSISNGTIEYRSKGEVPGHVLNQFSMDEYQGYFRIATTTGEVWRSGNGTAQNHVYVLDQDLSIVGRLEGIAPGERIYSARFMGSRAYLVTFKQVDPLFVIDLSNPQNPRVLGELVIPGYSDYLHPYDETHLIGIGKDTIDAGSFAWMQGVKIALFDVSDPENPREISKYMIGDRGTEWGDSYALSDHRAFLFNRERNLLVVPIELAERESLDTSPWTYGIHVWQGAYVFNISLEEGFALKGRITHSETGFEDWGYNSDPRYNVRRSLYIDNVLYTISDGLVKMNNLEDLSEIGEVEL